MTSSEARFEDTGISVEADGVSGAGMESSRGSFGFGTVSDRVSGARAKPGRVILASLMMARGA